MKNSLEKLIAPDVDREWQTFNGEFQYPNKDILMGLVRV